MDIDGVVNDLLEQIGEAPINNLADVAAKDVSTG